MNWLILGCVLIISMVVIGGITRLTQSGLSIVEWKPISGIIPPLSQEEWQQTFQQYKESPEFIHYRKNFTLSDFKEIYFWEYLHRLLGRIIGIIFLLPFLYFWIKGYLDSSLKKKLIIIFFLGLFQGILGWYMVKSGLVNVPHVSHYRLAAHLITAFGLIAYIFWVILDFFPQKRIKSRSLFKWNLSFLILLILQICYGAFVAGLKAGKWYNTFPKMGDEWIPSSFSYEFKHYGLWAMVESPPVVQFIHRTLAYIIFVVGLIIFIQAYRKLKYIPKTVIFLLILIVAQFTLGVFTLLYAVPISLGVLHQVFAAFLMLSGIYLVKGSTPFSKS